MIKALTRRCLGGADPTAPEVRQRCGTLAGGVGILLNTLLCLGKLGAGLLTGSIAVVADGLNNLSDAASSVITLIGFRLAGQAADEPSAFVRTARPDAALLEQLLQNFGARYENAPLCTLPAKLSVSGLVHEGAAPVLARPAFLYKEGLTAAERGTALHAALQFADLAAAANDLPG